MQWKTRRQVIDLSETGLVMGIVNATPDSFSDGGVFMGGAAVDRAIELENEGADIIDVGGESTKPGADAVSLDEELKRVLPVVTEIRARSEVMISVDTSKAAVARRAIAAGADIVNDVTGCLGDAEMTKVCIEGGVGVVVMHMQGTPRSMQERPTYDNVVDEVREFFEERFDSLTRAGMSKEAICFDPGIGFGKTDEQNVALLNALPNLAPHGRPVLLGVSRKSLIGRTLGIEDPAQRDSATCALTVHARMSGCMLHRVHAVKENVDAMRMIEVILKGGRNG